MPAHRAAELQGAQNSLPHHLPATRSTGGHSPLSPLPPDHASYKRQYYGGPSYFTSAFDAARGEGSFGILEQVQRARVVQEHGGLGGRG